MTNSSEGLGKGFVEKISTKMPFESIDAQCEPVCLIIFSEKVHVNYIHTVLFPIENVLKKQGLCPKRLGGEIRSSEDYLERLEKMVSDCSLALILLDGFRPNVLFEFGYVKAKRKPLIILKSKDAYINIKTLFRTVKDSKLSNLQFDKLCNPKIEVPRHLSDFAGKHILRIDWSAKPDDPFHPSNVLKTELVNKKGEITMETTRVKTKDLPPTLQMGVLESIIEVFGYYYDKAKVSLEKIEELYSKLTGLTEKGDMKPQIEIYSMISSIYIRQVGYEYSNSENISYLIAAQKINNDIIALSLAKEKENLRAKILMRNGIISQRLLNYTNETEYGYEAITAFEKTLRIFSSDQKKRETASAHRRIGETYSRLADIENTATNCEKAIKAYIKALKIYTRKEFLSEYIETQYGLGAAYYKLSEVRNRIENLKKSIEEIEKLRNMGKLLLAISGDYGSIQNLLGVLHSDLAEVEDNEENYKKVFNFYQEALGQSTLQKDPLGYAVVQNNLGAYYGKMANIAKDEKLKKENCENAIDSFTKALKVYTYEKFPQEYSETRTNLCEVYRRLAEVQDKVSNCKKAIENCEEALKIQQPKPKNIEYARTQLDLGTSYVTLAEVENPLDNYKEAIERYGEILKVITPTSHPAFYAKTQKALGNVYQNIAKIDERKVNCEKALRAYKTALSIYRELGRKKDISEIQEELKELSAVCNG